MKFTPTTQRSGGIFLHGEYTEKKKGSSCLRAPRLGLVVSHPKTPILNCFYHLLWANLLTVSVFSCLAKSYSVSGLTPLPHIPNQLLFTQTSAHEVLDANLEARVRPGFT